MKKALWIVTILFGLLVMSIVALLIVIDIPILTPEEEEEIKKGKLFWQWDSPYGPLNMHYVERGEGPNHILMLHGFRAHTFTWRALIDPLAKAGYHVWALDLIGYGLSDKPEYNVYNSDFFVQQVHAFMEDKKISKAHLVGNSMGGGLALFLALTHPDKVNSLILLSALGYPLDLPFYLSIVKHISRIWVPFLCPTMVRQTLKQIVYQTQHITDEQVEAYSLPYRFPGGINTTLLTIQNFDNQHLIELGKHYPFFTCPLLVIWGERDRLIPVSHYEQFLKDFPHAEKLLIADCGHIPQEEAPQQVLAAMLQFLQKTEIKSQASGAYKQ